MSGCAAIAVVHPEAGTGVQHRTQTVLGDEVKKRGKQSRADAAMVPVILGTHNQFSVDQFTNETILGQSLQLGLGPNLIWGSQSPRSWE
jgi:hypothetical protein